MDELDRALEAAWARVGPMLSERELRRRGLRREGKRAVAPWCLCIRASDPRISDFHALIDDRAAAEQGRAHTVVLGAELVRRLCRPVRIAWPGVPYKHAADLLGRSPRVLGDWIKRGVVKTRRSRRPGGRGWGKYETYVWTDRALDPNAHEGRGPDAMWGTAWQGLRVPDDFSVTVRRVHTGKFGSTGESRFEGGRFGGWHFVCPGLAGGETFDEVEGPRAETRTCGRRADKLYVPVGGSNIFTLAHEHTDTSERGHIAGFSQGYRPPSEGSPGLRMPGMRAACARCHGVVNATLYGARGWNRFVASVTGGLLYGREVERPREFGFVRRRKYRKQARRAAPVRGRVAGLYLAGYTDRQIGAELGMRHEAVRAHVTRLFVIHGVRGRKALGAKLGMEIAPGTARGDPETVERAGGYRITRRAARQLELLERGLKVKEIAERLGVCVGAVHMQTHKLFRIYRVHSRGELVAKVEAMRRERVKGVLEPRAKWRAALKLVG